MSAEKKEVSASEENLTSHKVDIAIPAFTYSLF